MRRALAELRHHPGRFGAVILAIGLAIGFIVAAETAIETEFSAMAKTRVVQSSKADLVVTEQPWDKLTEAERATRNRYETRPAEVYKKALDSVSGVEYEAIRTSSFMLGSKEKTLLVQFIPASKTAKAQWFKLLDGVIPKTGNEVALSQSALDTLGAKIGDTVRPNSSFGADGVSFKVVGVTDIPRSRLIQSIGVISSTYFDEIDAKNIEAQKKAHPNEAGERPPVLYQTDWSITLKSGDAETAKTQLEKAFTDNGIKYSLIITNEQMVAKSLRDMTGGVNPMSVFAGLFGAISLVVGTIIISTTFSILFTQRRRQIALLRLVGAEGRQVRRQLFVEALLIGLIGSLFGVALGVGGATAAVWWTGSLYWGLSIPWIWAAGAVGVGVFVTLVAAFIPALRATRVPPVSALSAVPNEERARQIGWLRITISGLTITGGVILSWLSLTFVQPVNHETPTNPAPVIYATGAGVLLSAGILFATPLFVPLILRFFGWLLTPFGPTGRMAAANAVRNPGRSAATATALMLAIGLIITLQVGAATMKSYALDRIASSFPIDLSVKREKSEIPSDMTQKISQIPGIAQTMVATSVTVDWFNPLDQMNKPTIDDPNWKPEPHKIVAIKGVPEMGEILRKPWEAPPDGVAYIRQGPFYDHTKPRDHKGRFPIQPSAEFITSSGTKITFKLVESDLIEGESTIVLNPTDFAKLGGIPKPNILYGKVDDRSKVLSVYSKLIDIIQANEPRSSESADRYDLGGNLISAAQLEEVVNTILMIVTGLLAVSVLIALVGMGNTLGLSVLERTRESGLLRALGTQRSSLRMMLAIEALMLAVTGVLVGALAGGFFAWMGSKAMLSVTRETEQLALSVDWKITGSAVGLTILAGLIASILPGRKASKSTPMEALADVG